MNIPSSGLAVLDPEGVDGLRSSGKLCDPNGTRSRRRPIVSVFRITHGLRSGQGPRLISADLAATSYHPPGGERPISRRPWAGWRAQVTGQWSIEHLGEIGGQQRRRGELRGRRGWWRGAYGRRRVRGSVSRLRFRVIRGARGVAR
eukprot:scaffold7320_cov54-Phaeocystis_antarctica.AAC.2